MLSKEQRKYLRALGHDRKVIVRIGQQGLTANVLEEIEQALDHHELVRAGIRADNRQARVDMVTAICRLTGAEAVQSLGNTVLLYRPRDTEPSIILPR